MKGKLLDENPCQRSMISMLFIVSSIKVVAEIALMAQVGQWLLGLLAGRRRDHNVFYQLLGVLTRPFVRAVRWITPRVVIDRHIPAATFVLLAMVWMMSALAKINICLQLGPGACR
jgi:hypothetical protein